jgi:hypothetical protein
MDIGIVLRVAYDEAEILNSSDSFISPCPNHSQYIAPILCAETDIFVRTHLSFMRLDFF